MLKKNLLLIIVLVGIGIQETFADQIADSIIQDAVQLLGVPYRYGGQSTQGMDCSGFVGYLFEKYGYHLTHSSKELSLQGTAVGNAFTDLRKGDLVFFGGRGNTGTIGHVGIFIALDDTAGESFSFIHAAVHGGVQISHYKEAYYKRRYFFARRILPATLSDYLTDTTTIYPDKENTLLIPSLETAEQDSIVYHKIQSGDTLTGISRRYGTTVKQLCDMNNISTTTVLKIGKTLRVK